MDMISVIICTHNPRLPVLKRTLNALRAQTLPQAEWEVVLVDNASGEVAIPADLLNWHPRGRIVSEMTLGLTPARLKGCSETSGSLLVFVDDDNVLNPDYLAAVKNRMADFPNVALAGGRVIGEFENPPSAWHSAFLPFLALRDLGPREIVVPPLLPGATDLILSPATPIGAGLIVRRAAFEAYVHQISAEPARRRLDRTGKSLLSAGDTDLVITALRNGLSAAYFPELQLVHLIPAARLEADYLGRLLHGIFYSWVAVRRLHGYSCGAPVARWRLPLERVRAWIRRRAWQSAEQWVWWRGDCGDLEARALR